MKRMLVLRSFVLVCLIMGPLLGGTVMGQVTEEWVARYDGPASILDYANAITTDSSGNVYVTGDSMGSGLTYDYATVAYDSSGTQLWAARYNGPGNSDDHPRAIATDASGNVYVTGESYGSGTSSDYATVAYDSSGTQLWVARYNGPGNGYDEANGIATDALGNVYVTGRSMGLGLLLDYATVAYDSLGTQLWAARYDGPHNSHDIALAMATDASGNVYVTGQTYGAGSSDYATVAYDSSGTQLWAAVYNGPANDYEVARAIATDASGNVYVTGDSYGSGTSSDYATVAYDSSGTQLWAARYNGPANDYEVARGIATDASGNVYVTGTTAWNSVSGKVCFK